MYRNSRREFLAEVGQGMLLASVGSALALDLGFSPDVRAEGAPARLTFGKLEPLVALMQETTPVKLQPMLIDRLRGGADLNELVAAAALANARTFGGEDYVGFHTMMALHPAYMMARELPKERQALPVLKVLYRNANRMQETGGRQNEVLKPVKPASGVSGQPGGEGLRAIARGHDPDKIARADALFVSMTQGSAEDAYNELLTLVEDGAEVHRVVLAYRAWDMLQLVGKEHAQTMLRQSVHYCVKNENPNQAAYFSGLRALLPKLLDQYRLASPTLGSRQAEDSWVERMSETFFKSSPDQAADAAAAALAEGMSPDAIGEAICLAANQLVLRDNGRVRQEAPNKPVGSVHGDGIGVHASDSANAWRNIARISNARNTAASLILGAYQVARDRGNRGGNFLHWQPYPREDARAKVTSSDPATLLKEVDGAIREKDQARACAVVARYGELGQPARPMFDVMLRYATSEDGALHAEKYYRTVSDEFAVMRPAFRWRQLIALARVTASEYGQAAPGFAEACKLLGV
ncbi:MAG TPA: hypothetical protein VG099_05660 [Gemmataceae bacterium]|jgi:hypothetical protein|nr:hypothetical protein [Gemmataceae bacterium]